MNITVLTPDQMIFEGAITSVKVPGTNGEFQILNSHAPIVSSLEEGLITIVASDGTHQYYEADSGDIVEENISGKVYTFTIEKGFIEVLKNNISLLVQGVGANALQR